jgi:signal transduction histidine kinase/DNA-binding response OmpR family regulator
LLSAIAAISGVGGVYWLTTQALQEDLKQRGQLLSNTLIISAETSSSLADFRRTQLAIASDPSIDNIQVLDLNYQPVFSNDSFDINQDLAERDFLIQLIQQAKKTGLSIGSTDPFDRDIYKVASLINISSLPQESILKPSPSLLIISLHTEQARSEAIIGALALTTLFIGIGLIAFIAIYYLMNQLVLKPSQQIVGVMKAHSLKQKRSTGLSPVHELGVIGQTFDHLAAELNAREQALEQALLKSKVASQAKSQFLASMNHEIRTPMNGVIGMLQLFNNETLTTKQRKFIDTAKSSADSLLILINDILDVSKIEAGKLIIEEIDFDLVALFHDVVNSFQQITKEKNLTLLLEVDQVTQPCVKGDPGRIRQILINLIGNALKFTQSGSIRITVSLKPSSNDHLQLNCQVIDTGIGIHQDKLRTLFDSFTQADSSTTREYGGSGLGLTIVKQLCQLMSGDIQVTSEVNKGSQFSFTLQVKNCLLDAIDLQPKNAYMNSEQLRIASHAHISESLGAELPNQQRRVLLVEDNAINQLVAEETLLRMGFSVDICSQGEEALEKLKNSPKDAYPLILMDCQMPVMDGYTATKHIRQGKAGEDHKDIIIIAMTANAMQGDKEKCLAAGMNDYLTKPIDEHLLLACLKNWLTLESSHGHIEEQATKNERLVWNQSDLNLRMNNNAELIEKILSLFIKNAPPLMDSLEQAIMENQFDKISDDVHALKGICGNIGAEQLFQACIEFENLLAKLRLTNQPVSNDKLKLNWQNFRAAYERLFVEIQNNL